MISEKKPGVWEVRVFAVNDASFRPTQVSRTQSLAGLVGQLRARADRNDFYAHPSAIARLVGESEVVRGGVSAAPEHDLDLIAVDFAEIYVRDSQLADLVARYELDANADRPNLVLRVIGADVWPFGDTDEVAPWPVVAMDLLDASDERTRRAGLDLIERHAEVSA